MTIESWFAGFVNVHMARYPRSDWPVPDTEAGRVYWTLLGTMFKRNGVHRDEANEASIQMLEAGCPWPEAHHTAFMALVNRVREARREPDPPALPYVRPEHKPGPWDAIETLQDLKDFCRSLGPIATRIGRKPRQDLQPLVWHGPGHGDDGSDVPAPGTP